MTTTTHVTHNGYTFDSSLPGIPVVAVRGLLGIVTSYLHSPIVSSLVDNVVCRTCWDEWMQCPPWNDTPPILKIPPICRHLEVQNES